MQPQDRRHSIRIHPELRQLRGGRTVAPVPAEPALPASPPAAGPETAPPSEEAIVALPEADAPAPPEAAPSAASPDPAPPALPGGAPVRLRRDGQRPLGFRGLELLSCALPGAGDPAGRLALWLAEDGRVAAQVVRHPGPCRSRPAVFRAGWIEGAADLDALLALPGPADALCGRGLDPSAARAPAAAGAPGRSP